MSEPTTGSYQSNQNTSPASTLNQGSSLADPSKDIAPAPLATEPYRGRFTILGRHAEGGLGRVSKARDEKLQRTVALKEIHPNHRGDAQFRERFLREAAITGRLEHPGIVPVYALDEGPDGEPFYAMRFIQGRTLAEAINEFHEAPDFTSLKFRKLLQRFVSVCQTIAYAHSQGVIHRDLKPANIMLGNYAETLVVDWGLAKVVGEQPSYQHEAQVAADSTDTSLTEAGQLLGTPAYMAPEQARGEAVGPEADIFALGAVFFKLLTGQPPYQGRSRNEMQANIRACRFPAPRIVQRNVPRALEAACLKAMAAIPERRYGEALELAKDVEQWLADEPVSAYPEPWMERLGRLTRRHRAKLIPVGMFMAFAIVSLSVSTALIVAQQQATEKQRQLAVQNYELSRKQSFDIIALVEASEPEFASVPALHDRRKDLLTTASNACQQFLQQEPDDLELQKRAAQIYRFAGNFNRLINETDEAERLYQDSLALHSQLSRTSRQEELLLADTLRDYAGLQAKLGHLLDAAATFNASLEIVRRWKDDEQNAPNQRRVALALRNLANVEYRQGKLAKSTDAVQTIDRAVDLFRGLVEGPTEHRSVYDPLLLAGAINLTAMIDRDLGQLNEAQMKHAEAVKLLKAMLDSKPKMVNEADVVHFMAECQIEQCKTWAKVSKPKFLASAETNAGVAINKLVDLVRAYPKVPIYSEALAQAYRVRGEMRLEGQNYQGAREHFLAAQKLLTLLVERHGRLPGPRGELGLTLMGLGKAARVLKDENAAAWFEQAAAELSSAVAQAPDEVQWLRALDELKDLRK